MTAEPYFAVSQPSETVSLENTQRRDAKGRVFSLKEYKLMKRAQYEKMGNPLALAPDLKNVPLETYEAQNAVETSRSCGVNSTRRKLSPRPRRNGRVKLPNNFVRSYCHSSTGPRNEGNVRRPGCHGA